MQIGLFTLFRCSLYDTIYLHVYPQTQYNDFVMYHNLVDQIELEQNA